MGKQVNFLLGISFIMFLSSVTVFAFANYSAIEIIDDTILETPKDVVFDSLGNVYVLDSGNGIFRIATDGTIAQIIDSSGDGTNGLSYPYALAVDSADNIYVAGYFSHNVFKIDTPQTCSIVSTLCTITEIIDETGDGTGDNSAKTGNYLDHPVALAVDSSENVYVAGSESDNAFKITTPDTCSTTGTPCTITEVIDSSGDGTNELDEPNALAVDSADNIYVAAHFRYAATSASSNNVFKIITPDTCSTDSTPCTITEIIDSLGDGTNDLIRPNALAVDSSDNIYVTGGLFGKAFKITTPDTCSTVSTPCTITQIIDSTGDGTNGLSGARSITTDSADNIYVAGYTSSHAFKITTPNTCSTDGTPCTITAIIDSSGDGAGNDLRNPIYITTDSADNIYVTGGLSDNVFKIFEIINETSDSCSSDCTPPSLQSIELNNVPNWLTAKNQTFNTGDKQVMKFVYFEDEGIDDITDVILGFGLPTKKSPIGTSELRLQINTFNGNFTSLEIEGNDKLFLNSTTVKVDKVQCGVFDCLEYTLEFIWAEIPFDNYFLIIASDDHRNKRYDSSQEAFTVIGESLNEQPTLEIYNRYTSTKDNGYFFDLTKTDKITDMWIDEKGTEWCDLGNDRFEMIHK